MDRNRPRLINKRPHDTKTTGIALADIKDWYVKHADKVVAVRCLSHDGIIALEAKMPNRHDRGHLDGMVVIPIEDRLLGFRIRTDGTMGYRCACGANSILLKEEAEINVTKAVYPHMLADIKQQIKERKRAENQLFKREKVK